MSKYYYIPGNKGKECHFNGLHKTKNGPPIESMTLS